MSGRAQTHTRVRPLQGYSHTRPSTARGPPLALHPARSGPRARLPPLGRPNPDAPAPAEPGFRALTTVVAVARGEMAHPAQYGRQGTTDATRKAGAGSRTPAGLRPIAGRQAPVSWQQVNSAPPAGAAGVCARGLAAPACPRSPRRVPRESGSRWPRRVDVAGAQPRCGVSSVAGFPLSPPGSPERIGLLRSVAKPQTRGGSQASAQEEAGCAQGMGAGVPPPGDTENWGLSLHVQIGNPCHTHLLN